MDIIKQKHPWHKRILHQFQANRNIPFRRKWFVGYDLYGNTYWEFTIDGNMSRLRRKLEPVKRELFQVDYFKNIPPQWLQWLRRTRDVPPSMAELIQDQMRQQRMRVLSQQADEKWRMEKVRLEQENQAKLETELNRSKFEENPWKLADETRGENPIESANIKPRS